MIAKSNPDVIVAAQRAPLPVIVFTGPITILAFEKLGWLREQLQKDGIHIQMPTGN